MRKFTIDFNEYDVIIKAVKKYRGQKNFVVYYVIILIAILAGAICLHYNNNRFGLLQINSLNENITVFIDNKKTISKQDINPDFKLTAGEHTIIISKDGFWPWIKNTTIEKKIITELTPFFIPQNTSGFLIGKNDSEYASILSLFQDNAILLETFQSIIERMNLQSKITTIDFYKNRKDVVIISTANGIFALEIEDKNIRNLQPIYKGKNPVFVKKDDNSIYILDNGNLMLVNY